MQEILEIPPWMRRDFDTFRIRLGEHRQIRRWKEQQKRKADEAERKRKADLEEERRKLFGPTGKNPRRGFKR